LKSTEGLHPLLVVSGMLDAHEIKANALCCTVAGFVLMLSTSNLLSGMFYVWQNVFKKLFASRGMSSLRHLNGGI
jgi:hypothetical protein